MLTSRRDDERTLMAVYEFLCLDRGGSCEIESTQPIEGTRIRCAHCDFAHVRQTFESYLRNADASRSAAALDALRGCHFG